MITILLILCNLCFHFEFSVATHVSGAKEVPKPPNIVLFLVHGLRFDDINEEIVPSLKDLAEKGIILDSFYTCPDSISTVSSLLFGKNTAVQSLQKNDYKGSSLIEKLKHENYNVLGIQKSGSSNLKKMSNFDVATFSQSGIDQDITADFPHNMVNEEASEVSSPTNEEVPHKLRGGVEVSAMHKETEKLRTENLIRNLLLEATGSGSNQDPFMLVASFSDSMYKEVSSSERSFFLKDVGRSVDIIVDQLSLSTIWEDTVFVIMSSSTVEYEGYIGEQELYSERNTRAPCFFSGGYIERALRKNGVSPYQSNSLVHVSDLHPTILSLTSTYDSISLLPSPPDVTPDDDEGAVSQWHFLTNGGEHQSQTSPPRHDLLYARNEYLNEDHCANVFVGAFRTGDFKLIVFVQQDDDSTIPSKDELREGATVCMTISHRLFNIKENPLERDDGNCDNFIDCNSLHEMEKFKDILDSLYETWLKSASTQHDETHPVDLPEKLNTFRSQILPDSDLAYGINNRKLTSIYDVLSKLYSDTSGSDWRRKSSWMTGSSYCDWYGVTCISDEVVELNLYFNYLAGTIPTQLGMLTRMTEFHLWSNTLIGSIPSQLGMMSNGTSFFRLYSNSLTGPIPSELGMMTGMTSYFSLHSNALTGSIPSQLGMMTKMTENFQLYSNSLTGSIPSQLGMMTKTTELYLYSMPLTGAIPSQLGMMTEIISDFRLHSNSLTGPIPSELGMMTSMTSYFYLHSNLLTGPIPSQLGMMTKVGYFYLYSNILCGDIPSQLGSLSNWNIFTANDIGTPCCETVPTSHSCAPTLIPTFSLVPSVSPVPTVTYAPTVPTNSISLRAFYVSTSGSFWETKFNWMIGDPCTDSWYGVTCENGEVIMVSLNANRLAGSIVSELGTYHSCAELSLNSNSLTGPIPSELGMMTKMTSSFFLYSNDLTGSIPSEIGMMTGIGLSLVPSSNKIIEPVPSAEESTPKTLFNLEFNKLNGSIPSQFGMMTSLTYFSIYSNDLTGSIPSQLGMMTSMKSYFWLNRNSLSSSIPSQMGMLTEMSHSFSMASMALTGAIPSQFGMLTEMTSDFKLCYNSLTGPIPSELGMMTGMASWFSLCSNSLIGPIPSQLGMMTKLSYGFRIYSNSLSGPIPSQLGMMTKLSYIFTLYSNSLTGPIPSQLGMMVNLNEYFNLYSNSLTGRIPSQLGMMVNLNEYFNLYSNSLSGRIPSQLGTMTKLSHDFNLYSNSLTGPIPSQLGMMTRIRSAFNLYSNFLTGSIPSQFGMMKRMSYNFTLYSNLLTGLIPSQLGMMTKVGYFYLHSNKLCGDIPSQLVSSNVKTIGNAIGTPCCESLPIMYTCTPMPLPTSSPSISSAPTPIYFPSPEPTPGPTHFPTSKPTHFPTSEPTHSPTHIPTSEPTHSPTHFPSSEPIPAPTSKPTTKNNKDTNLTGIVIIIIISVLVGAVICFVMMCLSCGLGLFFLKYFGLRRSVPVANYGEDNGELVAIVAPVVDPKVIIHHTIV